MGFSSFTQHYDNHMCLMIWTVFQVSDVAHEPLVSFSISEGLLYFPPDRCSLKALETSLWKPQNNCANCMSCSSIFWCGWTRASNF